MHKRKRNQMLGVVGATVVAAGLAAAVETGLKDHRTAAPSAAVAPAMPVPPPGGVTPPKPAPNPNKMAPAKNSFYVTNISAAAAYSHGLAAGQQDAKSGTDRATILDYGCQTGASGTRLTFTHTNVSNAQVQASAEQFARGYAKGVGSKNVNLLLGVGANNSCSVSGPLGVTWAHVVAGVSSWAKKNAPHTTIVGADDLEPGFGSASAAVAWAKGYSSVAGSRYINYGSADGCPQSGFSGGACNNGWSQETVWFVSSGAHGAMAAPEIYYSGQAKQWPLISRYGKVKHHQPLNIIGALNQAPSGGNNASQAWSQLHAALGANGLSTLLKYSLTQSRY